MAGARCRRRGEGKKNNCRVRSRVSLELRDGVVEQMCEEVDVTTHDEDKKKGDQGMRELGDWYW